MQSAAEPVRPRNVSRFGLRDIIENTLHTNGPLYRPIVSSRSYITRFRAA